MTVATNEKLSSKCLRLVEAREVWGFKICPQRLAVSHPLVATPLLRSDLPKACYTPGAAQVQDTLAGNSDCNGPLPNLAHPPTHQNGFLGVHWPPYLKWKNKLKVSPQVAWGHPYFSVAMSL